MTISKITLLEQLEKAGVKVDVDSYDPVVVKSFPFTPHDATSNQALISSLVLAPINAEMVKGTVISMPGATPIQVLDVLHAKFAKVILPLISGHVLAQTSPTFPYDREKIVEHARAYIKAYSAEGIEKDRICIKIPTTTAGVQAAAILKKEGIASLGTMLFSLPQAIAASQAGMYAISPYFNPCIAHVDAKYWSDVADPTTKHPMASRMLHIKETYRRLAKESGKNQPQIKGAGHITGREVMAQLDLGCDAVTVLPASIKDLLAHTTLPPYTVNERENRISSRSRIDQSHSVYSQWNTPKTEEMKAVMLDLAKSDPMSKIPQADFQLASTDVDYLEDGVLDEYNEKDEATKFMLKDAIDTFKKAEDAMVQYIADMQME